VTATWTATPQQVESVIAAVLPHASDDCELPVINNVRVELDGTQFLAVATDRYSLGICRADLTDWKAEAEPVEKITASLGLGDVKRLFAFVRPQRKDKATWELTDDALTVSFQDDTSLTIRTVQVGGFPNWRALVGGVIARAPEPDAQMAFTPRVVDSFQKTAKALGEVGYSWQFTSALKPVIVRIGTDFLGMLMPARIPDDAPPFDPALFGIESAKAVTP
jgi:hypothetical protein